MQPRGAGLCYSAGGVRGRKPLLGLRRRLKLRILLLILELSLAKPLSEAARAAGSRRVPFRESRYVAAAAGRGSEGSHAWRVTALLFCLVRSGPARSAA